MKQKQIVIAAKLFLILLLSVSCQQTAFQCEKDRFASFAVDPKTVNIEFFWRDDNEQAFKSIQNLKNYLDKKEKVLKFAMNGGMYEQNNLPKGLFIQNQKTLRELDTADGSGNFYLKPNGVFYLTIDNKALISETQNFKNDGEIKFATQSGPMLIVDGIINQQFTENSSNLNVRNGVGILPDNKVVFAMSRQEINFYEFAQYFKNLNCREALYLDGFVSRMYLPEENIDQMDGDFGIIIGITE